MHNRAIRQSVESLPFGLWAPGFTQDFKLGWGAGGSHELYFFEARIARGVWGHITQPGAESKLYVST